MFKVHVKYRISDDARASFAQYQNKHYFLEKIILIEPITPFSKARDNYRLQLLTFTKMML